MPFTAAHPLAVAPLLRLRWLDATCLVVGSMAPDFEYFLRGQQVSTISHTPLGLLVFDLPVTLALAAVFHAILKWPLLVIAPRAIAARLIGPARRWRWRQLVPGIPAALLGAATHLAWDAFTHAQGWGPRHYHWMKEPVALPAVGPMALHRVLQHTSTVLGLLGVALLIVRALRRHPPIALPAIARAWPRLVFALSLAALAAFALHRVLDLHLRDPGDLITAAIAGSLAGTVAASLALRAPARRLAKTFDGWGAREAVP